MAAWAISLSLLFFLLEWVPWAIQDEIAKDGPRHDEWNFWIQTLSGNWAPSADPPVSRPWYAFSAVIAFLSNNALGIVVAGLVWRLITDWRKRMKLNQIIAAHDQATKLALYRRLPGQMDEVRAALKETEELWFAEVEGLFGEDEAQRLRKMMTSDI